MDVEERRGGDMRLRVMKDYNSAEEQHNTTQHNTTLYTAQHSA
jgi:hypothetical protein